MTGATEASEAKDAAASSQEAAPEGADRKLDDGLVYESYDPLRLQQNKGRELLPFPTFDAALDEFYAKVRITSPNDALRQEAFSLNHRDHYGNAQRPSQASEYSGAMAYCSSENNLYQSFLHRARWEA